MRKQIQAILEREPTRERAAFVICKFINDELDLRGNGWFDDDQELLDFLDEDEDE